ncbi:hypothetical protein HK097_002396 [Rhizophlyctis rosea]|uniref:Uncharacterized protein n=1 Tax=Rhizophlyctis rosea TaxID=64517 RepID=A0AAD5S5H4_9FUNG|nr:hypothetical protein HK097_002396 [Rhizophlyctis rosea]
MPSIAPITATWSVFFTIYYIILFAHIGLARTSTSILLGDGSVEIVVAQANGKNEDEIERLRKDHMKVQGAMRAHGNFQEYVPLSFILILLCELSDVPSQAIHAFLAVLLISRIAHAHFGLLKSPGISVGREVGVVGTMIVMVVAGVWAAVNGIKELQAR